MCALGAFFNQFNVHLMSMHNLCVVVVGCIAFASGGTMTNGTDRVLESYISLIRYAEKDGNAHAIDESKDLRSATITRRLNFNGCYHKITLELQTTARK